jgi:hypothetical protein
MPCGFLILPLAPDDRLDDSVDIATIYGSCFDLHIFNLSVVAMSLLFMHRADPLVVFADFFQAAGQKDPFLTTLIVK